MSEQDDSKKDSPWSFASALLTRQPIVLLILGVLLLVAGAAGAGQKYVQIDSPWRITMALVGGILILFSLVLVWITIRSDPGNDQPSSLKVKSYGVTITYPDEGVPIQVNRKDSKTSFLVKGNYQKLPPDAEIWVFLLADDGRLWPHGPAEIKKGDKSWVVEEIYPGSGPRKRIGVYVVGINGQVLIQYYKFVGRATWDALKDIKAHYPDSTIEIKTPPITKITTDIVKCQVINVQLVNND